MCLDSIYMYISIYITTYICSCICTYISMYAFFKYVHMVPIVTLRNWQTVWARLLTGYLGKLVGQGKLQFLWCRWHYFRCRVRMLLGSYRVALPSFRIGFCWVKDWYHVKGNGRYGKHHASNLCWTWKHIHVDLVVYCSLGRLDRGQISESFSNIKDFGKIWRDGNLPYFCYACLPDHCQVWPLNALKESWTTHIERWPKGCIRISSLDCFKGWKWSLGYKIT